MGTLTPLINAYISGRVSRHEITRASAARVRTVLHSFDDSFGNRPVTSLGRGDVERWMADRFQLLSPGTRRNDFGFARQFCTWLVREGKIKRHPFDGIPRPKVPRTVPRALSVAEADALEAVLPDARARAIYALMRRCGLRRCEVLGLEVGDWDRHANTILVRGKGSNERVVAVPADVASTLAVYLASIGAHAGPMIRTFDGSRGISNSYLGMLMASWMRAAGIKHAAHDGRNCHSLRHTIASELAELTGDAKLVQDLLGHESLTSTQVYLRRASIERMREALERLAA